MNKKKRQVNKKHRKNRGRLKILHVSSLSKKKKVIKVAAPVETKDTVVEKKEVVETKTKKTTTKKTTAKKATTKKTAAKKK